MSDPEEQDPVAKHDAAHEKLQEEVLKLVNVFIANEVLDRNCAFGELVGVVVIGYKDSRRSKASFLKFCEEVFDSIVEVKDDTPTQVH